MVKREATIEELREAVSQLQREKQALVQEHAPCEETIAALREQVCVCVRACVRACRHDRALFVPLLSLS